MQHSHTALILIVILVIGGLYGYMSYQKVGPASGQSDIIMTSTQTGTTQSSLIATGSTVAIDTIIESSVTFLPTLFPSLNDCTQVFGEDKKDICEKVLQWNQAFAKRDPALLTDAGDKALLQTLITGGCVVGGVCFDENIGKDRTVISSLDITKSDTKTGIYPLFSKKTVDELSKEEYNSLILDNTIFMYALMNQKSDVCDRIENSDIKKACIMNISKPSEKDRDYYIGLIRQYGSK